MEGSCTRVSIVCTGLGRILRGYEQSTSETFAALRGCDGLDVQLFGAAGSERFAGRRVRCLDRRSRAARLIGWLLGKTPYFAEELTFAIAFLPTLLRTRPDVIICADRDLIDLLWYIRLISRADFRLLGFNGGPFGPPFCRVDFVQHLVQATFDQANKQGLPAERQTLLPHGFDINGRKPLGSVVEQRQLRQQLSLPEDRLIIIVVGAIQTEHKRLDYVIREIGTFASMRPDSKPYLLMLGQSSNDSEKLRSLAETTLGTGNFGIKSVQADQVHRYYCAADVFTLGTLVEAFGRVYVEAMLAGLPCVANNSANARYVISAAGCLADFEVPGSLANTLSKMLEAGQINFDLRRARSELAATRYSWDALLPQYLEMIRRCASLDLAPQRWSSIARLPE